LIDKIIDISRRHKIVHIGSSISVLPILQEIYTNKKLEDKVVMDNAHAHLAHALFLKMDAEEQITKFGIHCDRRAGCDASGGSLGHALGIAIGFVLADPSRAVHCIVSDGSIMEGSCYEALRLIDDLKLDQIHIYCNFNGYTAVSEYSSDKIEKRMKAFVKNIKVYHTNNGEGFEGLQGHYRVLK